MYLKKEWPMAVQMLSVGFYVAFSLLAPTGVGFYFDRTLGHHVPYVALSGLGLGTILMIFGVYLMVRPYLKEDKQTKDQNLVKPNTEGGNG